MITICNLTKSFKTSEGLIFALKNVSLKIESKTITVIGGENGSGKSVLMSIIAGLENPDSGYVESNGKVGLIFQEAETQILGETPFEDVSFGLKNLKLNKNEIEVRANSALEKTGLITKKNFCARFLSGGEKRRLAVACMIAMNFEIIIFDEPFANLDFKSVKQVNEIIKFLQSTGKTIIILTHEIEKCLGLADKFIVLFKGQKVFDGSPTECLTKNLEEWNIKNPLVSYKNVKDLIW